MKQKLLKRIFLAAVLLGVGVNGAWAQTTLYEIGTTDHDWTSSEMENWTLSNQTAVTKTLTEDNPPYMKITNGSSTTEQVNYTATRTFTAPSIDNSLVTLTTTWNVGNPTGSNDRNYTYVKFGDIKVLFYGQNYTFAYQQDGGELVKLSPCASSSYRSQDCVLTITIDRKSGQVGLDINHYTNRFKYNNKNIATTADVDGFTSVIFGYGGTSKAKWGTVQTVKSVAVTEQAAIHATVNAKYGDVTLQTDNFASTNATLYYAWPKYILKDGNLYNNQSRSAGKQYADKTTEDVEVDKTYSLVSPASMGGTAMLLKNFGTGVTTTESDAGYLRCSYGTSTNSSSLTLAAAGELEDGYYTFELGSYKKRGGHISVGGEKVGDISQAGNSGSYILTTLTNVLVQNNAVITADKAEGASVTDNIDYFLAIKTGVPATLGTNGYTTFASTYPLDLTTAAQTAAGITAYKASVSGKTVSFSALNQAVPANTGILLAGTADASVNIPVAASGTDVDGNAFLVNTGGAVFDAESGYTYFAMKKNSNPLTFATFAPGTVAIPATKAYLKVLTSSLAGARLDLVFSDESTGIGSVNSEEITDKSFYDLQGRRVAQPAKGLYIVNGKKVVVK